MHPIAALLALQGWEAMINMVGNPVAKSIGKVMARYIEAGYATYNIQDSATFEAYWIPRDWADVPESDLGAMLAAIKKGD